MLEPETERDPLEELAEQFVERHRLGERPSVEGYASDHPELSSRIMELFPTLLMMEEIPSSGSGTQSDSRKGGSWTIQRTLGDFDIIREIGRGGMGVVYEAHQRSLGRRVALKVLAPGYVSSPKQVRRFEREARAAARLHHTNIVPVFGFGRHEGTHFYVMQYIAAQPLDAIVAEASGTIHITEKATFVRGTTPTDSPSAAEARVEQETRVPSGSDDSSFSQIAPLIDVDPHDWCDNWPRIAEAMAQVADALAYAHRHGVLHRDIKPSNLLLDAEGTIWVTDFGLAKLAEQEDITESGDTIGTLRYMAPEQLNGRADERSDVYSLGLTLYEMSAMRPAFDESERGRLLKQLADGTPPPAPRSVRSTLPRDLETIILKAIAREPDRRYASAGALADDLRRFLEDRPILARRVTPAERIWRWCRRNPTVSALSATAISLLVMVAAITAMSHLALRESYQQVQGEREQAVDARAQAETERIRADDEKIRAEANLHMAIAAFESIFDSLSGDLSSDPHVADSAEQFDPLQARPVVTNEVADMLQGMLGFYEEFASANSSNPQLRDDMIDAHRYVGDIQQQLGHFDEAESAYLRALALLEAVSTQGTGKPIVDLDIASVHLELGRVLHSTARFDEADAHYEQAEQLLTPLAELDSNDTAKYQLARVKKQRGDVARTVGDPTDASTHYLASAHLARGLVEAHPETPLHKFLLARIYRYRPTHGQGGQHEGLKQAIEILTQLCEEYPEVPKYYLELSETYASAWSEDWRLHRPRRRNDDGLPLIEEWLREAVALSELLVQKHPGVPEYEESLVRANRRLGDVLAEQGDYQQAEEILREAVLRQLRLVERSPEVPLYLMNLAESELVLGHVLLKADRPDEAQDQLEVAISRQETFLQLAPRYRAGHLLLSEAWTRLADTLEAQGDESAAESARELAHAERKMVRESLAEATSLSAEELSHLIGRPSGRHGRGHHHRRHHGHGHSREHHHPPHHRPPHDPPRDRQDDGR